MRVRELIAALEGLNPNLEVEMATSIWTDDWYEIDVVEVDENFRGNPVVALRPF